jgi:hypothetical protein
MPVQRVVHAAMNISREETVSRKVLIAAAITAPAIAVSALAQQAGIKRTSLQNVDFPAGYAGLADALI